MKNNQRKQLIDSIIKLCINNEWWDAEQQFDEYLQKTRQLWKQYDTHLNYQFNKCGFCRKMKKAIVKQRWSNSEQYPLVNRLTCVNEDCIFYLVFN